MQGARYSDSVEKVKNYFAEIDKEILHFSPLFLRTLKCNKFCGACCPRFSLDYLKDSERWKLFSELYPDKLQFFEERKVDNAVYMSYTQSTSTNFFCNFLNKQDGLCTIHKSNPFHCEFEIIKLQGQNEFDIPGEHFVQVLKKHFNSGARFTQIDGTKGTKCEIVDFNPDSFQRDIEMLEELQLHYYQHFLKKNLNLETLIWHLKHSYKPELKQDVFIIGGQIVSKEKVLEKLNLKH